MLIVKYVHFKYCRVMSTEIDRKIAVILVADVVGYSKHMEKDENATIKSYNACEKILNKLLKKYKGSVFNTAGDSVLAEFPSAVNAVECGVDFQNEIKKRIHDQVSQKYKDKKNTYSSELMAYAEKRIMLYL